MFARLRTASAAPRAAGRRYLSGESHDAEHEAITYAWRKRTFIAIPFLGALALANVYIHMSHGHHEHEEHLLYPYQKKMLKKYPWEANECNLFDYECKKHFYEKAAGKHAAAVKH